MQCALKPAFSALYNSLPLKYLLLKKNDIQREVCPNPSNPPITGLQYKLLHYNAQATNSIANEINSTAKATANRMESTSKVTNLTAKT